MSDVQVRLEDIRDIRNNIKVLNDNLEVVNSNVNYVEAKVTTVGNELIDLKNILNAYIEEATRRDNVSNAKQDITHIRQN